MAPHNFGSACQGEKIVFGASRPGYNGQDVSVGDVDDWIEFMRSRGIRRVVCLLPDAQLAYYQSVPSGLVGYYGDAFGAHNVHDDSVKDFHLASPERLRRVMEFLRQADSAGEPVVVQCSGGSGRTGHVLAAWLVHARGLEPKLALEEVRNSGRNPFEAVHAGTATNQELLALLESVRPQREA